MVQGIAIVTRSTGVVGRATALQLAADGFDLALSDDASQQGELSQLRRIIQSKGVRCESFVCDLLKEESIQSLINDVVGYLGGVDIIFINPFDMSVSFKPLLETSMQDWDKAFAVNTRPVFSCFKHAAAQMIRQGRGGRIIVRSSPSVMQSYAPNMSAFTASLFAVRGLSQTAALELGSHNITVNIVAAGPLEDTDDDSHGYKQAAESYNQTAQQFSASPNIQPIRKNVAERVPLPQKSVTGEEIARVVSLLASKDCNFMTGQSINLNGGLGMH